MKIKLLTDVYKSEGLKNGDVVEVSRSPLYPGMDRLVLLDGTVIALAGNEYSILADNLPGSDIMIDFSSKMTQEMLSNSNQLGTLLPDYKQQDQKMKQYNPEQLPKFTEEEKKKLLNDWSKAEQGKKFDQDKVRLELISSEAELQLAKVLTFGAKKYDAWNWSKGIAYSRVIGAIRRHINAYLAGEDKDPESGLSHIAHAMCGCMFLLHFEKFKPEMDDRSKDAYTKA